MNGMASECDKIGDIIYKNYLPMSMDSRDRNLQSHWNQEVTALGMLVDEPHTPTMIDIIDRTIVMDYCGTGLTRENCPTDWEKQCDAVDAMQHRLKLYHQDLKIKNITVKAGQLYLIDWGMTSGHERQFVSIKEIIKEFING